MKHILFIFCDQLRYDCIGALGNPYIQTPHLDEIARDSVVFDRCYTPSPVCVPARLSMMSGQYCNRTGNAINKKLKKYDGTGFYGMLTESGYNSCAVGKMHYMWDSYAPIGFRKRYSQEEFSNADDDYTKFIQSSPYKNVFDIHGMRSELYYTPQVSQLPAEAHPTQWVGDCSIDFLDSANADSENIFLMSSFIHPHPPFAPPAPWNKLYRRYDVIPPYIPDGFDHQYFAPLLHSTLGTARLKLSYPDLMLLRDFYYACVSFVDYQVGRITDKLKMMGIYDDTTIVFSADHGEMLGDYENLGKRTMFSPASRVPLFIKTPGKTHEIRHDVCSLVDIAPTLLGIAGVSYDKSEFDGIDLFSDKRHEVVFSQYDCGSKAVYMVATEEDKLVYSRANDKYYYFKGVPENADEYDVSNPRCSYLGKLLLAHIDADCCEAPVSKAPKKKKLTLPFTTLRLDQKFTLDKEAARIPAPYKIDLES